MMNFMKKMFRGTETPAEEMKEAKAVKSGKITPKQYAAGEASEGHGKGALAKGKAMKSGKLSPAAYAKEHAAKKPAAKKPAAKKMAKGGSVKGCGVAVKGKTKGKMV